MPTTSVLNSPLYVMEIEYENSTMGEEQGVDPDVEIKEDEEDAEHKGLKAQASRKRTKTGCLSESPRML